jgi:hypothetical protein
VLQKRDESTLFNTGEWESPNRQVAAPGFAESILLILVATNNKCGASGKQQRAYGV